MILPSRSCFACSAFYVCVYFIYRSICRLLKMFEVDACLSQMQCVHSRTLISFCFCRIVRLLSKEQRGHSILLTAVSRCFHFPCKVVAFKLGNVFNVGNSRPPNFGWAMRMRLCWSGPTEYIFVVIADRVYLSIFAVFAKRRERGFLPRWHELYL